MLPPEKLPILDMEISLTTPAILFPAISLLLLGFSNRFVTTATLIRQLKNNLRPENMSNINRQIQNLQLRVRLIIFMQAFGVLSIMLCTLAMIAIYYQQNLWGSILFGFSLLCMVLSLLVSLWEVLISSKALNVELDELKNPSTLN